MEQINQKEIGKRIRAIREKANMTQHDLFLKTDISTTQISAYENGKKSIGLQTIAKIATALNTTIDCIYYGPEESKPISKAMNKGELIANCISSLFDLNVVCYLSHEDDNPYVPEGFSYYYKIGFNEYAEILDDFVSKLDDFRHNKNDYPDPNSFKSQLLALAAKKINDLDKIIEKQWYSKDCAMELNKFFKDGYVLSPYYSEKDIKTYNQFVTKVLTKEGGTQFLLKLARSSEGNLGLY